jgi:uncharacterized repeat protein (TIGR01451 family)
MSHANMLKWLMLLISLFSSIWVVAAANFEPTLTMLGLSQKVAIGQQIEWLVNFSNIGDAAGQNIVISDTVGAGLQVDHVQINSDTVSVSEGNVTVSIPALNPDESIQFSIFTTIISEDELSNTACVTAANFTGEKCLQSLPVQALPNTGEVVFWRQPFLWLALMAVSFSILLMGLGMLGMQTMGPAE